MRKCESAKMGKCGNGCLSRDPGWQVRTVAASATGAGKQRAFDRKAERVRGNKKVFLHLMFGLIVVTAEQIFSAAILTELHPHNWQLVPRSPNRRVHLDLHHPRIGFVTEVVSP